MQEESFTAGDGTALEKMRPDGVGSYTYRP